MESKTFLVSKLGYLPTTINLFVNPCFEIPPNQSVFLWIVYVLQIRTSPQPFGLDLLIK